MKKYFLGAVCICVIACEPSQPRDSTYESRDHVIVHTSSNIAELEKLLNLESFRPSKVEYRLAVLQDSVVNELDTVTIPRAAHLEALLYFDSTTFDQLIEKYRNLDYNQLQFQKEEFKFPWLNERIKNELQNSKADEWSETDFFFGTGEKGRIWFLEDKLLLIHRATNRSR